MSDNDDNNDGEIITIEQMQELIADHCSEIETRLREALFGYLAQQTDLDPVIRGALAVATSSFLKRYSDTLAQNIGIPPAICELSEKMGHDAAEVAFSADNQEENDEDDLITMKGGDA